MTDMDTEPPSPLLAAKLEIAESRYREALYLLDRITAHTAEEEAQKLVLSGQCFEGLNDVARASEAYSQARSIAPTVLVSILRQGVLRYRRGDREGARALLYRYVELESGNPEAYYYLSLCEQDPLHKAAFVTKLLILDGPTATWSRELFRSLAQ